MNYPLISEYVEAIKLAQDNLDKLSYLSPVCNDDGLPIMSNGSFATVFKMKDERSGKLYALKCFIKEQVGRDEAYKLITDELEYVSSDFITSIKYLNKELFVGTSNSDMSKFPVLLMDWVEGVTLDGYIREHIHDQYELRLITFQFCRMAAWLMAQPFAHGDIKPDNIIVKADGSLVLVDYDAMYVPTMKGQMAREVGSPNYQHPARTISDFNEHIDDFSLASIAMQLYAIALQPKLLSATQGNTLLMTKADYRSLDKSQVMQQLHSMVSDAEFAKLLSLFFMAFSENSLSHVSFRAFIISKPTKPVATPLTTVVTDEDIANGVEDEYGVIYSKDGARLIKAKKDVFKYYYADEQGSYHIKEGTKIICDNAFNGTLAITNGDPYIPGIVFFPQSVIAIGNNAFKGCAIGKFELSNSLLYIGDYAFEDCSIREFTIPTRVTHLGKNPFLRCSCSMNSESDGFVIKDNCLYTSDFKKIICCIITNNTEYIEGRGFYTHYKTVSIADGTEIIGTDAFNHCDISHINLPSSIKKIEERAFAHSMLFDIIIPSGVSAIEDNTFWHCINLEEVSLPNTIKEIGRQAFGSCIELIQINLPNGVQSIGDQAFSECNKIKKITIPESVSHIGCGAFNGCGNGFLRGCGVCDIYCMSPNFIIKDYALYTKDMRKLISCFTIDSEFVIPNDVQIIGKYAFEHLYLERIEIPNSVISIDQYAMTCKCLTHITIPGNVKSIKDRAFEFSDIKEVTLLEGVEEIGNKAFYYCRNLRSIYLPQSLRIIEEDAFEDEFNLIPGAIYIPKGTRSKFEKLLPTYKNKLKEVENE